MKSGLLLINKPVGITSTQVCQQVKKKIPRGSKVGHTGTLDPFASGLLVVGINGGTKTIPYITPCQKSYKFEMCLGVSTDSYDVTGNVVETIETSKIDNLLLKKALASFVPGYEQIPPLYSALKHQGKRFYEYARDNEFVDINSKKKWVDIYDIQLMSYQHPYIDIQVSCGHGTYIRSLAVDLAAQFHMPAHVTKLARVNNGDYQLADAINYDQIQTEIIESHIISLNNVLNKFDSLKLTDTDVYKFKHGQNVVFVKKDDTFIDKSTIFRINSPSDEVEGLGKVVDQGASFIIVQPILNF